MESFKTIEQDVSSEIEEKKSKFIADVFYVENQEQVENYLKVVKKKYFDAKHHCFAYRICEKNMIKEKQSDDGEPSGTAGMPMLNILQKNDLVNVLVIVTRYFGGTLLGTGGLVRAYSEALTSALQKANFVIQELGYEAEVMVRYTDFERLKYYCNKNEINITNLIYEQNVIAVIESNKEKQQKLIDKNQHDVKILKYNVLKEKYIKTNI